MLPLAVVDGALVLLGTDGGAIVDICGGSTLLMLLLLFNGGCGMMIMVIMMRMVHRQGRLLRLRLSLSCGLGLFGLVVHSSRCK